MKKQMSLFSPEEGTHFTPTAKETKSENLIVLQITKCIAEQQTCCVWLQENKNAPSDLIEGARRGMDDWLLEEVLLRLRLRESV